MSTYRIKAVATSFGAAYVVEKDDAFRLGGDPMDSALERGQGFCGPQRDQRWYPTIETAGNALDRVLANKRVDSSGCLYTWVPISSPMSHDIH